MGPPPVDRLRSGGRTVRSGLVRVLQSKTRVRLEQWWRYGRHHRAELDPFRVLWLDPDAIYDRNEKLLNKSDRHITHVLDGEWDVQTRPFESRLLYRALEARFTRGIEWEDTTLYQRVLHDGGYWRGVDSEEEFFERAAVVDGLFRSIAHKGYRTQDELIRFGPRTPGEVKVQIGRDGTYRYANGKHRLCIAKILDIPRIPVNVSVRHATWQSIRNEVAASETEAELGPRARQHLNHPDVRYL